MNKIIPFNKDITFHDPIGEITSIALDDTLKFEDSHTIKGELIVRGCHKYLDKEEDFSYPLPVLVAVDDKYDTKEATIMVDDFYYEIVNDNILRVKIDLLLDDLNYKEEGEEVSSIKMTDTDILEINPPQEEKSAILDLFEPDNVKKEYSIYRVYILNENDTLDNIINKYKVTKEELEEINDLTNLHVGSKLIIPSTDE